MRGTMASPERQCLAQQELGAPRPFQLEGHDDSVVETVKHTYRQLLQLKQQCMSLGDSVGQCLDNIKKNPILAAQVIGIDDEFPNTKSSGKEEIDSVSVFGARGNSLTEKDLPLKMTATEDLDSSTVVDVTQRQKCEKADRLETVGDTGFTEPTMFSTLPTYQQPTTCPVQEGQNVIVQQKDQNKVVRQKDQNAVLQQEDQNAVLRQEHIVAAVSSAENSPTLSKRDQGTEGESFRPSETDSTMGMSASFHDIESQDLDVEKKKTSCVPKSRLGSMCLQQGSTDMSINTNTVVSTSSLQPSRNTNTPNAHKNEVSQPSTRSTSSINPQSLQLLQFTPAEFKQKRKTISMAIHFPPSKESKEHVDDLKTTEQTLMSCVTQIGKTDFADLSVSPSIKQIEEQVSELKATEDTVLSCVTQKMNTETLDICESEKIDTNSLCESRLSLSSPLSTKNIDSAQSSVASKLDVAGQVLPITPKLQTLSTNQEKETSNIVLPELSPQTRKDNVNDNVIDNIDGRLYFNGLPASPIRTMCQPTNTANSESPSTMPCHQPTIETNIIQQADTESYGQTNVIHQADTGSYGQTNVIHQADTGSYGQTNIIQQADTESYGQTSSESVETNQTAKFIMPASTEQKLPPYHPMFLYQYYPNKKPSKQSPACTVKATQPQSELDSDVAIHGQPQSEVVQPQSEVVMGETHQNQVKAVHGQPQSVLVMGDTRINQDTSKLVAPGQVGSSGDETQQLKRYQGVRVSVYFSKECIATVACLRPFDLISEVYNIVRHKVYERTGLREFSLISSQTGQRLDGGSYIGNCDINAFVMKAIALNVDFP